RRNGLRSVPALHHPSSLGAVGTIKSVYIDPEIAGSVRSESDDRPRVVHVEAYHIARCGLYARREQRFQCAFLCLEKNDQGLHLSDEVGWPRNSCLLLLRPDWHRESHYQDGSNE